MDIFQKIAERKIKEAMERGEFNNLMNEGKPLSLEEDALVPEELRIAYKVLKNAGCLPPELEIKKEILSLSELINNIDDDKERLKKIRQLNFRLLKLNMLRKTPLNLLEYEERFLSTFIK